MGNNVEKSSGEKAVIELHSPSDIRVFGDKINLFQKIIPVENQLFSQALRLHVKASTPVQPCYNKISATNTVAVDKGDKLLIQFYVRRGEETAGSGAVGIHFGNPKSGRSESVNTTFYVVTNGWQKTQIAFMAREDYPPGMGILSLCLGSKVQVIEISQIAVMDFGKEIPIADMPQTRIYYKGDKPDDPWRKAAAERIEKYRKADLNISIFSKDGHPVEAASVYVKMKRHAFDFGSTVTSYMLNEQNKNGKKYRDTLLKLFNKTVFENEFKWVNWDRSTNHQTVFKAAEWLLQNNLPIRGHHLIAAGWPRVPKHIEALKDKPDVLRNKIESRIAEMASAWKGKVLEWDVLNEPHLTREIIDLLGQEVIIHWFKVAHDADPNARLYINDFGILGNKKIQDFYEDLIRFLLANKAPIHSIGVQAHYDNNPTPPETLLEDLDRLGALGLPILISEHSINSPDEVFQANYTRDFMTTVFSHPAVGGIIFWGFWSGDHFKPNAAYFREDWSVKPAGQKLMDFILKEWWTNVVGKTDKNGQYKTRGFLGEYEILIYANGKSKTVSTNLSKDGRTLEIQLD